MHTNAGLRLQRALAEHGEAMPDYLREGGEPTPARPAVKDRTAIEAAEARTPRRLHRRRSR